MGIKLFCDSCANTENFEKVRVIEVYDPKNKGFELTTDDIIYIRCKHCGNIDPIEMEEEINE